MEGESNSDRSSDNFQLLTVVVAICYSLVLTICVLVVALIYAKKGKSRNQQYKFMKLRGPLERRNCLLEQREIVVELQKGWIGRRMSMMTRTLLWSLLVTTRMTLSPTTIYMQIYPNPILDKRISVLRSSSVTLRGPPPGF